MLRGAADFPRKWELGNVPSEAGIHNSTVTGMNVIDYTTSRNRSLDISGSEFGSLWVQEFFLFQNSKNSSGVDSIISLGVLYWVCNRKQETDRKVAFLYCKACLMWQLRLSQNVSDCECMEWKVMNGNCDRRENYWGMICLNCYFHSYNFVTLCVFWN